MMEQKKQNALDIVLLVVAILLLAPLVMFVVKAKQTEMEITQLALPAGELQQTEQPIETTSSDVQTNQDEVKSLQPIDDVIGTLIIPKLDEQLLVYDGTQERSLMNGVGLLEGSAYPGSKAGNALLTGHRGTHDANIFLNLDKLEIGDKFYFKDANNNFEYQIYNYKRILPDQVEALKVPLGRDIVTLITCDPYLINSHRLLYFAERVVPEGETTDQNAADEIVQPTPRSIVEIALSAHWSVLAAALFGLLTLGQALISIGKRYVK